MGIFLLNFAPSARNLFHPYIERPVLTSSSLNPLPTDGDCPLQPVKLLAQRADYTTCHIYVPEDTHRLPAIALNGRFYSFFRSLNDPAKALNFLLKLSIKGNQVALTYTRQSHVLWVYESDGQLATSRGKAPKVLSSSSGPANCWVIGDRQPGYRVCSLKVPDLPGVIPGLANEQKLFSLYRREKDADATLKLGARLSQRGDEIVILCTGEGYATCIYEPGATVAS